MLEEEKSKPLSGFIVTLQLIIFLQHAASNCQEEGDASNPNSQQQKIHTLEISPANKQTHPLRNHTFPANPTQKNGCKAEFFHSWSPSDKAHC